MMVPARCSPKSRSTSVMGIRASRPMGTAAILPSLTHRRTVSGCNPRRLATSPERSNLVFSVLITRIDYQIGVNLSIAVHPYHFTAIVVDPVIIACARCMCNGSHQHGERKCEPARLYSLQGSPGEACLV